MCCIGLAVARFTTSRLHWHSGINFSNAYFSDPSPVTDWGYIDSNKVFPTPDFAIEFGWMCGRFSRSVVHMTTLGLPSARTFNILIR
jgi:hypothetical protein